MRDAVAQDERALQEELGDLLFSGVNVCRFLGFNAEGSAGECAQV